MSGASNNSNFDKAFDALKKWYSDHTKPISKKDAHDFSEIKKELIKIQAKKLSADAKEKEMLKFLQEQKEKNASRIAGFVLMTLAKQGFTPQSNQAIVSVSPGLIQLRQILVTQLPSGPNVVEKSVDLHQVRVHFASGKLESTYRHAALIDTLDTLKIVFSEEKTHGSIPIVIINEKSIQSVTDWQNFNNIFKETYNEYIDLRMNTSIEKFQASEISRQHEHQKSHQDVLEAATAKIKELEKKSPVTGAALEQRTQALQHILVGIEKIKAKKLRENECKIELDKLLSSAGHNIQNAEAVKILHQAHEDLHLKGLAKKEQTNKRSNKR